MGLSASDVSAVIVTRGDVDLGRILSSLPYEDQVVWDNSKRERNASVYGRYLAMAECKHDVIFFQDDDLVFTAHDELLAAYEPDRITGNMPDPWYTRTEYDKLGMVLVGAGSLMHRDLPWPAFERYLAVWPEDALFLDYCDFINAKLAPGLRLDLGYEILDHCTGPDRINTQPGSHHRRAEMLQRVFHLSREAA